MSVSALQSLLESRWHGPAVHGHAQPAAIFASGIAELDGALAPRGIPAGRLTEIFGGKSCGKTTLAYGLLARCTSGGDLGALVDPQRSFFAPVAEAAGMVLPRLIVVRPKDAAACRRAIDALIRSGACSVVVLDSTQGELLQTHHCARLVAQAEKTGTTFVVLSAGTSQPLASFASLRLRLREVSPLWQPGTREGDERLAGYRVSCDVVKSRVSTPGRSASFSVMLAEVRGSWDVPPSGGEGEAAYACAGS
jgi:RecA/RadA recombinase